MQTMQPAINGLPMLSFIRNLSCEVKGKYMIDPKEPAFPCPETEKNYYQVGLTQRDYLAAMAMQGMLSNENGNGNPEVIAIDSYLMADAMIERSKV